LASLFDPLVALVALVTLDVSSNDLKQLPDQLGQLPNLVSM
jgi:Leucine-rich repeat (LRR) protein